MGTWRVLCGFATLTALIVVVGGWVDRWCASRDRIQLDRGRDLSLMRMSGVIWRGDAQRREWR